MARDDYGIWTQPGATMSDKSARKEFGLTQDQIVAAIRAGKLQYRINYMHGNPWFRLIRKEVEALVRQSRGGGFLQNKKLQTDLANIDRQLRSLKKQQKLLEERQALVAAELVTSSG
jgi:hypothetical protein